ncbi:hypothetical protein BMS83_09530, partial [Leuconostoc pseudomesenteroides]
MSKYSNEFKLIIVNEWLVGQNGLKKLAKKYNIPTFRSIVEWRDEYLVTGSIGSKSHKSETLWLQLFAIGVVTI